MVLALVAHRMHLVTELHFHAMLVIIKMEPVAHLAQQHVVHIIQRKVQVQLLRLHVDFPPVQRHLSQIHMVHILWGLGVAVVAAIAVLNVLMVLGGALVTVIAKVGFVHLGAVQVQVRAQPCLVQQLRNVQRTVMANVLMDVVN